MPSTKTDRLRGLTTSVAVKGAVLVASTANLTFESTQTVDGVAVSTGDRVLLKDQTDASENGIYTVQSSTWQRATDFDGVRDLVQGTLIYVNSGTAYGDLLFAVTSTGDNIPGTDDISFTQALATAYVETLSMETVSSSGATMASTGVSLASTTTSTASTFTLSQPSQGLRKEILIEATATGITIDTSATTIVFMSSGGTSSTSLTYAGTNGRGGAVVLRGTSNSRWHILSKTDGWT